MHFKKQDMIGGPYRWDVETEILFSEGQPTRRLFDRYNGQQVLFVINAYAATLPGFTVEEGRAIEQQLSNNLPLEAKSEISVFNWIRTNASATIS
jgi:hypothetical protein